MHTHTHTHIHSSIHPSILYICPYGPYNIYDPSIYPPIPPSLHLSIQFVYLYVRMGLIIYSFIHSFIHSSIKPFIHTFIHPLIHPLNHSFIHSFIHPSIHPSILSICPYGPYNMYDPSIYPPTHLTLPPSIQFVYLYVRMGLIIYWGETTQGETTHGRNDSRAKRPT